MAIALFLNLKRKGEISVNFLYEFLLKIVSIARGYILCPAGSVQNNTYQTRKAPFEESGAETSSEADRQRGKARRYRFIRIVFIIFIILLCLILAVASPLRCFALGYVSETIVELILSALAGTAAYAFAAAGGAELIACLLIGMGASITVSVIAAAINTAVECGAWQDFVINCQNNFEIRKNQGTMALAMGGTAFLYAYDWVKEHIIGIKPGADDSSDIPLNSYKLLGTETFTTETPIPYSHKYKLDGNLTLTNHYSFPKQKFTHFLTLSNSSIQVTFKMHTYEESDFHSNWYSGRIYGSASSACYSPVFTASSFLSREVLRQVHNSYNYEIDKVENGVFDSFGIIDPKNSNSFLVPPNNCIALDKKNNNVYDTFEHKIYVIRLKNGKIIRNFSSINEFAYKIFYEGNGVNCVTSDIPNDKIYFFPYNSYLNPSESIPVENKKYYDKSKDTIATTAGSVRTKVKDGSITSDTDGKVTVKVNSPAIPTEGSPAIVTPETKINEPVKVTDISTTLEGVQTMNPGDAITIGSNNIELGAQPMGDKLPFSALKTISNMMNTLFISKTDDNKVKAPVIPVDFKVMNQHIKFNIDFSPLDPYVGLVRIGLSVSFLITTYLCFKKWIVNKEL